MPKAISSPAFRLLPPHVLLLAIMLSYALDRWLPLQRLWGPPCGTIGATIIVLALGVNVYCALLFGRRKTTVRPFETSSALVTEGFFRYSRNPIYVSMVFLLIGFAIGWGSLSPWVVPPLFVWIIDRRFIRHEETMLADTFGEAYREYCRQVRRWI